MDEDERNTKILKAYFLTLAIGLGGLYLNGKLQRKRFQKMEFEKFMTNGGLGVGDLLATQPRSRQQLIIDTVFNNIIKEQAS